MKWKKIKYLIDNISKKDDEEKIKLSRRTFLIGLPTLVVVPKLIEEVPTVDLTDRMNVACPISPSAMIIPMYGKDVDQMLEWQEYMIRTICNAFSITREQMGMKLGNIANIQTQSDLTYQRSGVLVKSRYRRTS